jgi:hypothetical protein
MSSQKSNDSPTETNCIQPQVSLRDLHAKAAIRFVALKAENQFSFVNTPEQTGVNRIDEIRKINSGFSLARPASGGTQEFIQFTVAYDQFHGGGMLAYHACSLLWPNPTGTRVKPALKRNQD